MAIEILRSIQTIETHTAGEPTRIIMGGVLNIKGKTINEKRNYLFNNMGGFRKFLCNEPRGHAGMAGALVMESNRDDADFAVIFFTRMACDHMCGHGTIGVACALIETGMLEIKEPITNITLETPGGIIKVKVIIKKGKIEEVSFIGLPSFLYKENFLINIPKFGKIKGDIAFGGLWYFYVNSDDIGISVTPNNINKLTELALAIKYDFNKNYDLPHPTNNNVINKLSGVSFVGSPIKNSNANQNNVVIVGNGFFDRSPCGTGTCGRMAVLFGKNNLSIGENFYNESITGGIFRGKIIKTVQLKKYKAIIPEIAGRAYITGFSNFILDKEDIFGYEGFLIE